MKKTGKNIIRLKWSKFKYTTMHCWVRVGDNNNNKKRCDKFFFALSFYFSAYPLDKMGKVLQSYLEASRVRVDSSGSDLRFQASNSQRSYKWSFWLGSLEGTGVSNTKKVTFLYEKYQKYENNFWPKVFVVDQFFIKVSEKKNWIFFIENK